MKTTTLVSNRGVVAGGGENPRGGNSRPYQTDGSKVPVLKRARAESPVAGAGAGSWPEGPPRVTSGGAASGGADRSVNLTSAKDNINANGTSASSSSASTSILASLSEQSIADAQIARLPPVSPEESAAKESLGVVQKKQDALRKQLKSLDSSEQELKKKINFFEKDREEKFKKELARVEAFKKKLFEEQRLKERRNRGTLAKWERLRDLENIETKFFRQDTTCIAIQNGGCVFCYESAPINITTGLSETLRKKLAPYAANLQLGGASSAVKITRKNGVQTGRRPVFVAAGSQDRCFIEYDDGTLFCQGPESLQKIVRRFNARALANLQENAAPQQQTKITCVAFGKSYETFVALFSDGAFEVGGSDLPKQLKEKLFHQSQSSAKNGGNGSGVKWVSLGPSGEWFLEFADNELWWGDVREHLIEQFSDYKASKVRRIYFGDNGAYCVRYQPFINQ
eukprot:g15945.t1